MSGNQCQSRPRTSFGQIGGFAGTRRIFLRGFSCLVAGAVVVPFGALGRPTPLAMRERSLDELTFSLFAGLLHTTFRVDLAPGQTVDVELTQASLAAAGPGLTTRPSPGAVSYERFSLIFRGAQGDPLGQGIHRFEHPQVGRFRMFIVPIRLRHSGYASYEAVFTRARPCSSAPV